MLMDMAYGIELELRDMLKGDKAAERLALNILRKAMDYFYRNYSLEWFNNDDNFSRVMTQTLFLKNTLLNELGRLEKALDKSELSLRGWNAAGSARVMLLAGWSLARTSPIDFSIDLQGANLTASEGEQLAALLASKKTKLTAIDVRNNESLGEAGCAALVAYLRSQKQVKGSVGHTPISILGVTPSKPRLDVPKSIPPFELRLLAAEFHASAFSEGISAAMGDSAPGKGRPAVNTLNRRSAAVAGTWNPLIWAAKVDNIAVAEQLIRDGYDVNEHEDFSDKAMSGYAPIHWAAIKGHLAMLKLLLENGADMNLKDKHGDTPTRKAERKGHKEVLEVLEAHEHATKKKPKKE